MQNLDFFKLVHCQSSVEIFNLRHCFQFKSNKLVGSTIKMSEHILSIRDYRTFDVGIGFTKHKNTHRPQHEFDPIHGHDKLRGVPYCKTD